MYSNFAEESQTFKYAMLTSKVVQVLYSLERQDALTPVQINVLSRGGMLVAKIIEGSQLIEGNFDQQFSPSEEGLTAYGYALTSIETLNADEVNDNFINYFNKFKVIIDNLINGTKEASEIILLKKFFSALGHAFSGAIDKKQFTLPKIEHPAV